MDILLVEDDAIIAAGLAYALRSEGWAVVHCAGADDYIVKPFRVRELLARIRSVLRRSCDGASAGGGVFTLKFYKTIC